MAPAAARTRPAWPAWTSVPASALRPDDRRHLLCLHRDRGYRLLDGYLVRQRRHLAHRHQSPVVHRELRLRLLGVVRILPDVHPERGDLRRPGLQDVRLGHPDARRGHRLLGHLGVDHEAHRDGAPGRGCCRPYGVRLGAGPGTGCYRPDADAAWACRKATLRVRLPRWCLLRPHQQTSGTPALRMARHDRTGSRCRRSSRVRLGWLPQVQNRRRQPVLSSQVLHLRVQRWALTGEVRPAWASSLPWVSRVPEPVPWRRGRPHGPCERRGLPVSRTVP